MLGQKKYLIFVKYLTTFANDFANIFDASGRPCLPQTCTKTVPKPCRKHGSKQLPFFTQFLGKLLARSWFSFGFASVPFGCQSVLLWFALARTRFCFGPVWFPFGSASAPFSFHSVLCRFAWVLVRFCLAPRWFPIGSVSVRCGSHSVLLRHPLVSIRCCFGSFWFAFGSASVLFQPPLVPHLVPMSWNM